MGGWLRHRSGDVGVTAGATTQECTQVGQKWPLGAILGYLCTLLRRESRRVARVAQPLERVGSASSLASFAWSERQTLSEWRRC